MHYISSHHHCTSITPLIQLLPCSFSLQTSSSPCWQLPLPLPPQHGKPTSVHKLMKHILHVCWWRMEFWSTKCCILSYMYNTLMLIACTCKHVSNHDDLYLTVTFFVGTMFLQISPRTKFLYSQTLAMCT